ncbi:MAG: hypothetical protein LBT76_07350 [Tannerella sp.]|nr:hypothetical protein [Tannerella sp.]
MQKTAPFLRDTRPPGALPCGEGGGEVAGLLHCVRKDGARRSFQDTCYCMAISPERGHVLIGVADMKGNAL